MYFVRILAWSLYFTFEQGNACIQMKMHLMFWYVWCGLTIVKLLLDISYSYSMSVLYFLQLKEDRSHHPVVEKMMLLNEVSYNLQQIALIKLDFPLHEHLQL